MALPDDKERRPLDFLGKRRGKEVVLTLGNEEIVGKLIAFDIHLNVWIETLHGEKLIRGGAIKTIGDI